MRGDSRNMMALTRKRVGFLSIAAAICIGTAMLFYPSRYAPISFPDGKEFAFTVFDDTDRSTAANVRPIYDALYKLGIITTKSVWVLPTTEPDVLVGEEQTLDDPDYLAFVLELQSRGFEIASHGARDGSTKSSALGKRSGSILIRMQITTTTGRACIGARTGWISGPYGLFTTCPIPETGTGLADTFAIRHTSGEILPRNTLHT
jgi:hypothetical protein